MNEPAQTNKSEESLLWHCAHITIGVLAIAAASMFGPVLLYICLALIVFKKLRALPAKANFFWTIGSLISALVASLILSILALCLIAWMRLCWPQPMLLFSIIALSFYSVWFYLQVQKRINHELKQIET